MADTPHVQYTVLHQVPSMQPNDKGGFHKVFRVHYEAPNGTRSFVDMPATHYTAENVHAAISHEMQHILQVDDLGKGGPPPPPPDLEPKG